MKVNCVDTINHIIYLAGPTKNGGSTSNYNFFGPSVNHRFIIENSYDAFTAAQSAGQVGIWFLDRSTTNKNWVLNYIANTNEHPASDSIVIPQLPQTGTSQFTTGGQFPLFGSNGKALNDYIGGSLIWATNLSYVTFTGIDFEVDNFYPAYALSTNNYTGGFNNDVNGEMSVPQAIDCENCQSVTFNGVAIRHTSGSGILAGATASPSTCSTGGPPSLTSFCVLIDNSSFYDIGDSGIRIGHYPLTTDLPATIVQDVLVQNNLVQGFSRVFADGEGIATGNGYNNQILNNTVTDGYHAGISICFNGCGRTSSAPNNVNSNNIWVNNNLISNLMQGITSDGGSLYYNVGGDVSAMGDKIYGNVVHDTTDSYIIDLGNGITKNPGTGYGGEGIYLDKQTASVDVENNLVFNVDGHGIHLTQGVAKSNTYNTFKNNIFAFANEGMFVQGSPWFQNGCPSTPIQQVQMLDNLLVFDIDIDAMQTGRSKFNVIQGCTDSCAGPTGSYTEYQLFQGNDYWSTVQTFLNVSDAFKIQADQTSTGVTGTTGNYSCTGSSPVSQYFSQSANNWQTGSNPISMMEDAGGAGADPRVNNSAFPSTGTTANVKEDFKISNATGLGQFNPNGSDGVSGTNGAISGAGSTVSGPSTTCTTVQTTVCPTFPTYVYGSTSLPF
jgi:hypothetical protein